MRSRLVDLFPWVNLQLQACDPGAVLGGDEDETYDVISILHVALLIDASRTTNQSYSVF